MRNHLLHLLLKKAEIKVSRSDAITETGRIKIENKNLIGSIALKGGLIDDITLKNYNSNQAANSSKVVLLNPKKIDQSYYLETGWATSGNEIVPIIKLYGQLLKMKYYQQTCKVRVE